MAMDALLLAGVELGYSPPTLRLYGWSRPCVTLGHHQNPERELDFNALNHRDWDWAFRCTGGRCVLHADEITYAIFAKSDSESWCESLSSASRQIAKALEKAMGTPTLASTVLPDPTMSPRADKSPTPLCFASKSQDEIHFHGRKLVGSAQRRLRNSFLQHGALPLSGKQSRLIDVQPGEESEKEKRRLLAETYDANWSEALGQSISFENARDCLSKGLGEGLQVEWALGELNTWEENSWQKYQVLRNGPEAAKNILHEFLGRIPSASEYASHA
jgi:lipoate-protein ligase A